MAQKSFVLWDPFQQPCRGRRGGAGGARIPESSLFKDSMPNSPVRAVLSCKDEGDHHFTDEAQRLQGSHQKSHSNGSSSKLNPGYLSPCPCLVTSPRRASWSLQPSRSPRPVSFRLLNLRDFPSTVASHRNAIHKREISSSVWVEAKSSPPLSEGEQLISPAPCTTPSQGPHESSSAPLEPSATFPSFS